MVGLSNGLYAIHLFIEVVHSEEVVCSAGCYDKAIVGNRFVRGRDGFGLHIDLFYMTHVVAYVLVPFELASERERYVALRQSRRGDLVEERGERVKVIAVDDLDFKLAAVELLGEIYAGEASTYDHDGFLFHTRKVCM